MVRIEKMKKEEEMNEETESILSGDPENKCHKCKETINRKTQLKLIKQGEKKNKSFWIMTTLETIILIGMIILFITGNYIKKEIYTVETCQGQPTTEGLNILQQLEKGGTIKWNDSNSQKNSNSELEQTNSGNT